MPKQIIIAEQHRIAAVFWEDRVQELVVATGNHQVGDIYLGIVENVLPGIDAAFVNIGDSARNGFIHVTDLGPLRLKRSSAAITELLAPQQKVLVQIMKEPTGNKGPRLTGNITMPGRYVVLMPFDRGVKLSQRIENQNERNRLRALAILIKPAGMGLLVRTEAEGKAEEAIMQDLESLQKQWETIQQEANSTRPPALLNRDDDFIQRVLRDIYTADVNRIVLDSHTGVKRVKQYLLNWSRGKTPEGVLIDQYRGNESPTRDSRQSQSILEYFRVNAAIREALKPRVDLPSGGYIIIEPTEALTVIDVNSGSFTRSATARETVLWTNCEAATEIARQLRLRNLAGVIVVDFIDMDSRKDQLQVLEHFNKQLRADKAKPQIAQLSELGLIELTRKRQGQNIYELFGRTCPTCGGLGHTVHLPGESSAGETDIEEPTVAVAARETRTWRETPTAASSSARWGETSDLAAGEEDQALDLVYHPSYQERTAANKNRRRRGQRIGEGATKEETPKVSRLPIRPGSSLKASLPAETEGNSTPEPFSPVAPEGERIEKSPRSKPSRQESEPPEIVVLEMTPEEQEVYAWMGISPLVKSNLQLKNPKSAIINLVEPGQEIVTITSQESTTMTIEPPRESIAIPDEPMTTANESPSELLIESTAAVDATEVPLTENGQPDLEPLLEDNNNGGTDINRRRRRRSSANGSEE
jgi:ribonuclease E